MAAKAFRRRVDRVRATSQWKDGLVSHWGGAQQGWDSLFGPARRHGVGQSRLCPTGHKPCGRACLHRSGPHGVDARGWHDPGLESALSGECLALRKTAEGAGRSCMEGLRIERSGSQD